MWCSGPSHIYHDEVRTLVLPIIAAIALSPAFAADDPGACTRLTGVPLRHAQVLSADRIPAGTFRAPDGHGYEVPAFCRVQGLASPTNDSEINFEVWFPAANWNERYYQHGEGGGGGIIDYGALASFVRNGAVGAATDDGHKRPSDYSSAWALHHPEKIIDKYYRGLKETTDGAKSLIQGYFGKAPRRSYFEGCSGGGGYALQAAQRFPDDWDGILVGAPANNVTGYFAAMAWNSRLWLSAEGRIPPAKLPAIQRAALATCKSRAHVLNGIPADPRFCQLDPATMSCTGAETNECLTGPQVATLRALYRGPHNPRTGQQIYVGFPTTMETRWAGTLTSGMAGPAAAFLHDQPANLYFGNDYYRFFVFDNSRWDIATFNFDSDMDFSEHKVISGKSLASIVNAASPDLSALRIRGAKVLMYVGWGDEALSPLEGIAYYESVARKFGGMEKTRNFYRLFMVPGMGHCGNGPGANSFGQDFYNEGQHFGRALRNDSAHNIQRALEAWVETGRKPDRIVAVKYADDDPEKGAAFTRPICPFPQMPMYLGTGNRADAVNFDCKLPAP
jgi:hypothetical protein